MVYQLSWGLFVEGSTDIRFLATIVQRTIQKLILSQGKIPVDVLELSEVITRNDRAYRHLKSEVEKLVQFARTFSYLDALILHFDADASNRDKAMQEHFEPAKGAILAQKAQGAAVCECLVPLIPVRNQEAWLLADPQTLLGVLNTNLTAKELDLPNRAKQFKSYPNPKEKLEAIVRQVNQTEGRGLAAGELYLPLARRISLIELEKVSSYQQFVADLSVALRQIGIIT